MTNTVIVTEQNTNTVQIIAQGPVGPGVPPGGTANQVLTKSSATDYDTAWKDPTGGGATTFIALTDTPNTYTASNYLRVNSTANAIEFAANIPAADVNGLATVATSGSYTDLSNQPTIPTNNNQLTNGANYITSAGAPVQSVAGKTGTVTLVKADVGLANVDNTSDTNKPVSTATQTALNGKENSLGNPTSNGQILSSTTAGVRSWIDAPSGGGGSGGAWASAGYAQNVYYPAGFLSVITGSTVQFGSANTLTYQMIPIMESTNVTRIGIENTSSASGQTLRLGIYDSDNGRPNSLIVDGGTISLNSAGEQEVVINQTLAPGNYFVAMTCSSTSVNFIGGSPFGVAYFGIQTWATASNRAYGLQSSTTGSEPPATALPSTAPATSTITVTNEPIPWLRRV